MAVLYVAFSLVKKVRECFCLWYDPERKDQSGVAMAERKREMMVSSLAVKVCEVCGFGFAVWNGVMRLRKENMEFIFLLIFK